MTKRAPCRALAVALFALVAFAVPSASAASLGGLLTPVALLTGKSAPCAGRVLSQPFAPWADSASYFPVAGGNFESGAGGWALTGGAAIKPGGAPFVAGSAGASLDLPAGASATTPSTCVDLGSPTLRFFSTGHGSVVTVSVVLAGLAVPVGVVLPGGAWQPAPAMLFLTNVLSVLSPTGTVNVALRFTAASGDARIDDVFIDPYRRT